MKFTEALVALIDPAFVLSHPLLADLDLPVFDNAFAPHEFLLFNSCRSLSVKRKLVGDFDVFSLSDLEYNRKTRSLL